MRGRKQLGRTGRYVRKRVFRVSNEPQLAIGSMDTPVVACLTYIRLRVLARFSTKQMKALPKARRGIRGLIISREAGSYTAFSKAATYALPYPWPSFAPQPSSKVVFTFYPAIFTFLPQHTLPTLIHEAFSSLQSTQYPVSHTDDGTLRPAPKCHTSSLRQ
jgi:hypothetical protein